MTSFKGMFPGAELRVLYPDGRDEQLVGVKPAESITDPAMSLDGNWVYYSKYYNISTGASASMTKLTKPPEPKSCREPPMSSPRRK